MGQKEKNMGSDRTDLQSKSYVVGASHLRHLLKEIRGDNGHLVDLETPTSATGAVETKFEVLGPKNISIDPPLTVPATYSTAEISPTLTNENPTTNTAQVTSAIVSLKSFTENPSGYASVVRMHRIRAIKAAARKKAA